MPGSIMNASDYFRISLTASDEMVARALQSSLPGRKEAGGHAPPI